MSRRHLESALVAGALIENGMEPAFRFTRVRFQRTLYPPEYESIPDEVIAYSADDMDPKAAKICCKCGTLCTKPEHCLGFSRDGAARTLENPRFRNLPPHEPPMSEDDFGVHSLQFSGDGRQLIAGAANTSIRIIDVTDGCQQMVVKPSKWTLGMPITCLRYMPTNLYWVLVCTPHGDIFCFSPEEDGFETLIKEDQQTYCLDISPNGMELATAGKDTQIRVYGLYPGTVTGFDNPKNTIKTRGREINPGDITCDLKRDAFPYNNEPTPHLPRPLFPGGRPDQIVDRSAKPYVVNACYSRPYLAVPACGYPEPAAYTDEPGNGVVVPRILGYRPTGPADNYTEGHSMRITALKYHPTQPSILASASWDKYVKVWDTRTRDGPVHDIYGPHVCSPEGLDMEGDIILTASWRKRQCLEIWDVRCLRPDAPTTVNRDLASGDVTNTLRKQAYMKPAESIPVSGVPEWHDRTQQDQGEYLYAARLLPSRAVVCGGSGFNEVRIVHRDNKLPILRIPTDSVVQSLDSILEGRYIAFGCASGSITIAGLA